MITSNNLIFGRRKLVMVSRNITKSSNILIVYDTNSVGTNRYSTDVNPTNIAITISNRETALGFTPTTITSYAVFEALSDSQIANYAHIWDVGYDTLITSSVSIRYKTYLSSSGAMFLLGENGSFIARDNSLSSFITETGGGNITVTTPTDNLPSTVAQEFRLVNSNDTIQFNAPGRFSGIGSGTVLVNNVDIQGAVWKTGSLLNYPTAAITSVLDINFLVNQSTQNTDFIDNLSIILNTR